MSPLPLEGPETTLLAADAKPETKQTASRRTALKALPLSRVDRTAQHRIRRTSPAISIVTTRQVYPDEDAAAI
jgi:hypothetical protein